MTPVLFSPITLAGKTIHNRVAVSPMCQYSASNGEASAWHLQHLSQYAISGAGMVMIESTAVTPEGRITARCLGLYTDEQERALGRVLDVCRSVGDSAFGIQLAHAGRKGSSQLPWRGGAVLPASEAWPLVAPSSIPYDKTRSTPTALTCDEMVRIRKAFASAARRAERLGIDAIELHAAHGYLLHTFLSPLSNERDDAYGGSLVNRMRFPLEIAEALRAVWPADRILGARVNCCDFTEGGGTREDTIAFAERLKSIGFDYICVSSGSLYGGQKLVSSPGYLLEDAARLRAEVGIKTQAVGLIVDPHLAESALASGQADMVALARAFLDDPRWMWHAAEKLGTTIEYPVQYALAHPCKWPGASVRRLDYMRA